MDRDDRLHATARTIYNACYASEDWPTVGFDEAERFCTAIYRQAVGDAQHARVELTGGDPPSGPVQVMPSPGSTVAIGRYRKLLHDRREGECDAVFN